MPVTVYYEPGRNIMKIKSIRKIETGEASRGDCCPPGKESTAGSACCTVPAAQSARNNASCCGTPGKQTPDTPPCCGPPATATGGVIDENVPGFLGWLDTPAGRVPQIATLLTLTDHLGACKARWALNRMNFIVPPGLYAIGTPSSHDPTVVTCNYKMTFDIVRQALTGRNVWLLVLETFGVNVWCAAGKGSFGTEELTHRIKASGLAQIVSHRRLLLPILGAPGIAAHEVSRQTGFAVTYAAIRADDLPAFLDGNLTTTPAMRELTFSLYERLILVPVELLMAFRTASIITLCLFAAGLLTGGAGSGIKLSLAYVGAMLTGVAVGPVLLPWLPGRSFAFKGAAAGLLWSLFWYLSAGGSGWDLPETIAAFLALPAVSAFYTLNFTGCSTYTSRTGVKKEMRRSLPLMGGAVTVSVLLLIISKLVP